jgi:hypothetical protein
MPLTHQYLRRGLPLAVLGVLLLNGCGPSPTENVSSADCQSIKATLQSGLSYANKDPNFLPFADEFDHQLSVNMLEIFVYDF